MDPVDFEPFLSRALHGMLAIAAELGDGLVNVRPDLAGANSPFVILHHCIGVTDWWVGAMGADRPVQRDRDAEFRASGTVAQLTAAVAALEERLRLDLETIEPSLPVAQPERLRDGSPTRSWTRGDALIHTLEELAQHHGQLEITRDLLLASAR